jgi:hypothetical protein
MQRRHHSLSAVCLSMGVLATGFGLVGLATGASAHTPSITADCSGVSLKATAYDGGQQNQWSVTIDGSTTSGTFGAGFEQTFAVPQDREFSWSARIAAHDGAHEGVRSGSLGPCVTPTEEPTTEPPTEEPTTEPPTEEPTTEPPTEEPTTEPPTEEPTTEPPTEEPTTEPPTEEPTTEPPTEEPTTEPPTEEPTTDPPTEEPSEPTDGPSTVLGDDGDGDLDGGSDGGDLDGGVVLGDEGQRTLPDTGAPFSAFQVDEELVPAGLARASLAGGLLLLVIGAWPLWRRRSA